MYNLLIHLINGFALTNYLSLYLRRTWSLYVVDVSAIWQHQIEKLLKLRDCLEVVQSIAHAQTSMAGVRCHHAVRMYVAVGRMSIAKNQKMNDNMKFSSFYWWQSKTLSDQFLVCYLFLDLTRTFLTDCHFFYGTFRLIKMFCIVEKIQKHQIV